MLPKQVKPAMDCHSERSEGSRHFISSAKYGNALLLPKRNEKDPSPASRDQDDSLRLACFTYLRNATLVVSR